MANLDEKIPKILLIYPPSILAPGFARKTVLPLGIAYLAAVLRNKGANVAVVDCIIEGIDTTFSVKGSDYYGLRLEEIRKRISQGAYDIVGISCQFSSMLEIVLEICKIAKDCEVKYVIVGGPHASAQPESLLLSKLVDYVFIGEAEKSIADFVDCLMGGNTHYINNISGLAYMDNGHLHSTSGLSLIENIDSIPFPARDLFPIEKYFTKCSPMGGVFKSRRTLSMATSRGCPGKCTFCASARFWGMKFRARSPENVLAEIRELRDKYRIEEVQFQDDNFTLNKKRALEICRGMKERIGLPWSVPSGLALWSIDKEIIDAMSDAGCHYVAVAIESGNQRVLSEVIKKPLKLDKVPELCRHFKKRKIKLAAFFITGFPDETLEEIRDTFNFASKCNLDTANFYFPTPLPGSPLWTQAEKENLFVKGFSLKNAIYDRPSLTSKNWTLKELIDVVHHEKRMFYLKTLLRRPRILLFRIFEILKHNPKQLVSMIYSQLFSKKIVSKGE
ncbi:MAG: radical SAM protein [Nitrospirota bacterium]